MDIDEWKRRRKKQLNSIINNLKVQKVEIEKQGIDISTEMSQISHQVTIISDKLDKYKNGRD